MGGEMSLPTKKPRRSLRRIVGLAGEFTDAKGNIVPCRVVKHEVLGVLQIKYWSRKAGKVVTGYISQYEFRPDKSNVKDEL
jgi:hypothetical protein